MKQAEVIVGARYQVNVGAAGLAVVVVKERITDWNGRTKFRVQRLGADRVLPKARSASALRPLTPRQALAQDEVTFGPMPASKAPPGPSSAPVGAIIEVMDHLACPSCGADSREGADDFSPPADELRGHAPSDPAQCLVCLFEGTIAGFRDAAALMRRA